MKKKYLTTVLVFAMSAAIFAGCSNAEETMATADGRSFSVSEIRGGIIETIEEAERQALEVAEEAAKKAEEEKAAEEAEKKAAEEAAKKAEEERIAAEKKAEEERLAKEAEEARLAEEARIAAEKTAAEEKAAAEAQAKADAEAKAAAEAQAAAQAQAQAAQTTVQNTQTGSVVDGNADHSVVVEYDAGQTVKAYSLLDYVNQTRESAGVGALVWSEELENYCISRIPQIIEARSQGLTGHTGYSEAENLAYNNRSSSSANEAWNNSETHHNIRIMGDWTQYAAVGYQDPTTGAIYWIEAFK